MIESDASQAFDHKCWIRAGETAVVTYFTPVQVTATDGNRAELLVGFDFRTDVIGAEKDFVKLNLRGSLTEYAAPYEVKRKFDTVMRVRSGDTINGTPGHSYGHQSVLVRDREVDYWLAGDLSFSQRQLQARGLQGIASNLVQARDSLERVGRLLQERPGVYLPSHDPDSLRRLAGRERL